MGILRQGILGGFRGKVGNVVGSAWKGLAVIKAMPLSVANPRTAPQVLQRTKFSQLVILGSKILATIVKPLWDRFSSGMSGYNAFISRNRNAFNPDGMLDLSNLVIANGRMIAPTTNILGASATQMNVEISNPTSDRFALPTDRLFALFINARDNSITFAGDTGFQRGTGSSGTFSIPGDFSGGMYGYLYTAYMRFDGSEVSDSSTDYID